MPSLCKRRHMTKRVMCRKCNSYLFGVQCFIWISKPQRYIPSK